MEGLTNGVDKSPSLEAAKAVPKPPTTKKERGETSTSSSMMASPMSTGTEMSSSEASSTISRCNIASKSSPAKSASVVGTGGAIQKTSSAFSPRTRRSKLTLDVRSSASPQQQPPEIACPMCPHKETSAARMEEHVNRSRIQ